MSQSASQEAFAPIQVSGLKSALKKELDELEVVLEEEEELLLCKRLVINKEPAIQSDSAVLQ